MELYEKLLQRIENDEPIYCNKTFAKDLEKIANEHHQEQVNVTLGSEKQIREIIAYHCGGTYEAKQKATEQILNLNS